MMQEDSNGESSFEFVDKKSSEESLSKNGSQSSLSTSASLISIPSGGNLLSNVAPPSALPSFVLGSNVEPTGTVISKAPISSNTPLTPSHAFYPTKFSPVIPPSKESDSSPISKPEEVSESAGDGGSSLFSWVKGAVDSSGDIFSRVAEKAKSSVDSMITTLDPQMREFLHSGGDVDIIVASESEMKVSPIREAFQDIFGKATVFGMPAQATNVAAQPVGFLAAMKAAEERIAKVRLSPNTPPLVHLESHPVIAVENFLLEVSPEKWFDVGLLVLSDPSRGISLQTYTQMTPVPTPVVALAKEDTPADYPLIDSGFSVTVGSLMASNLHVHHSQWHQVFTGVPRRDMILLAAKALAGIYKSSISSSVL